MKKKEKGLKKGLEKNEKTTKCLIKGGKYVPGKEKTIVKSPLLEYNNTLTKKMAKGSVNDYR